MLGLLLVGGGAESHASPPPWSENPVYLQFCNTWPPSPSQLGVIEWYGGRVHLEFARTVNFSDSRPISFISVIRRAPFKVSAECGWDDS